ncbi:MAG TPA: electron transfer flavoprotein subunit alpha/FixB family protein [Nitrososphaeraceae archaeon]|jgi:electron transfer flavoprotein alpha subunit|nr:electron transfer flavoprotein subunit alpha/FixB family protein [Nitrososphaeraceae archaeon]
MANVSRNNEDLGQSTRTGNNTVDTCKNQYRHTYVVIEHEEGKPLPVSLEMLGEARRLIDNFNNRYSLNEKVVAIVLGTGVRQLCEELLFFGADAVIYADSPELRNSRNLIDTKVISSIAKDRSPIKEISPEYFDDFQRPRYMFFAADNIGRQLSSTVMAELESGLASDINKLVIEDLEIKHEHKTKGKPIVFEKTLEMYRPDFSGFLWTTILCLDNRNPIIQREYHPQACSIIPGVFSPLTRDTSRKGVIVNYEPYISEDDLARVKVLDRRAIKSAIDFDKHKCIISFGRGIKNSPEENTRLVAKLSEVLDAEIGISLPVSKRPYTVSEGLSSKYFVPDRVIGTSGRKVNPQLYIAVGISGAVQHLAGMKESEFVISINVDENSQIKDESDIFVKGKMEEVLPALIEEIREQRARMVMKVKE